MKKREFREGLWAIGDNCTFLPTSLKLADRLVQLQHEQQEKSTLSSSWSVSKPR